MFGWKRYILKTEGDTSIWTKIKEPKVDMEDIIERYMDKNAMRAAPVAAASTDVVKIVAQVTKEFFSPEEAKSIQMSLPRLPKPSSLLKDYLIRYEGNITPEMIQTMYRAWPKEAELKDLLAEDASKGDNEKWGLPE